MALPSIIQRLYSFTGFQQAQGNDSFPGTQIDVEFDQTNNAVADVVSLLKKVVRPDGKFANGSVTRNALAADVLIGLGASRPWDAGAAYAQNDTVTRGYGLYVALKANNATDPVLVPSVWALQADLSQAVVIAPGSVTPTAFADASIPEIKLAAGAASNRVIAPGAVDRSKAARNLGVMPVGAETDFAGFSLPPGWLFCAGQAVSRTTYADLFAALSPVVLADTTIGQKTLANVSAVGGLGLRGAAVEGPGIPAGTILVGDGAGLVSMSNNATATGSQVTIRLFPFGRGDGATTFNVPDRRGYVIAGRDDMGGTAAGRLVQPFDGSNLAGIGGATAITLVNANLPAALPAQQVTVGYPGLSYATYSSLIGVSQGAGGTTVLGVWQGTTPVNVNPGPQTFNVTNANAGGGQGFSVVQPTGVANRIIFTGV